MTKSTITRERLEQLADNNTICKVSWDERIELAQIALAAMDSEPVAYMYDGEDGTEYNGHNEFSGGGKGIPLYRHAQQPVDSEPVGYLFHNEYGAVLYSISDDATDGFSLIGPIYSVPQPAPVVPEEWTIADAVKFCKETGRQDAGAAMDAWNACRAAMLNGGKS